MSEWTEERLQRYVDDGAQENSELEFKAAGALSKDDRKKDEVVKDVSGMANAAGGVIIYGIKEKKTATGIPVASEIDPIDPLAFDKERLENIISGVRPKIAEVRIHTVEVAGGVSYVIEVPQGKTAHQARDCCYYRRRNFKVEAMEDYEVREVMGRNSYPDLDVAFRLIEEDGGIIFEMKVSNYGSIVAMHACAIVRFPSNMAIIEKSRTLEFDEIGRKAIGYTWRNIHKDYISENNDYAITRYDPLLPNMAVSKKLKNCLMTWKYVELANEEISVSVCVDNAPPKYMKFRFGDIPKLKDVPGKPDYEDVTELHRYPPPQNP